VALRTWLPPDIAENDRRVHDQIDLVRTAMESEVGAFRAQAETYLRWYSPPWNSRLRTHDAWGSPLLAEDNGLTRANFPIARACVDIWASLEAAKFPMPRAEPERRPPPAPSLDQAQEQRDQLFYGALRQYEGMKAAARSAEIRRWQRQSHFAWRNFTATRRKDLYGFSWMKTWPDNRRQAPIIYVQRNPTTVYPIWSSRDPGDTEAVLCAGQEAATVVLAKYPELARELGATTEARTGRIVLGQSSGEYRELDERWWNSSRTMLWIEEFWWIKREFDAENRQTSSTVHMVKRILNQIVERKTYERWEHLPWVYFENTDERSSWGWSDIASVIDINDEFNRRASQEGDIIGHYAAPRFQLLGGTQGVKVEFPGPFELIPLFDQARIEQILTRIDVFPTQQHFNFLTDLLHRVTGLPPIVWGLIANAQTSGRALTASWKATEARLAPKLMRNEESLDRLITLWANFAERYNWRGAKQLFEDNEGNRFRDFRWQFPAMEPRDFQEVTMDAITRRDAGFITTPMGMRATGDEAAEDTMEEVLAEYQNIFLHPDKKQAFLMAQNAELQNIAQAQELAAGAGMVGPTIAQGIGQAREAQGAAVTATTPLAPGGGLPPTQAGAPGNAGVAGAEGSLTSGTLMRNGDLSGQWLETRPMA
jgi:hypothetical protein